MKKYCIILLICFTAGVMNAQKKNILKEGITIRVNDPPAYEIIENYDYPSKKIFKAIEKIVVEEKMALKKEVEIIQNKLKSGEISTTEAENLKKSAATVSAENMEKRIALEELKLKKIIQDYTDNQIVTTSVDSVEVEMTYGNGSDKKYNRKQRMTIEYLDRYKKIIEDNNKKRYEEQGVIAFGLNNMIVDGKFSSDFKTWDSKFYEYGYTFKWRLSKNPSSFYFKYGFSLLFNNLKTTDNQYFVKNGDETDLLVNSNDLKVARLKNVQLIFPVHFEIDLSKPDLIDGIERSRKERSFRFGLGGYGGLRLHSRQIIKYKEDGVYVKEKSTDDFNLNNFTYGISGYFGYRSMSLYAKYDINTLFKNKEGRGISLGLRLEI